MHRTLLRLTEELEWLHAIADLPPWHARIAQRLAVLGAHVADDEAIGAGRFGVAALGWDIDGLGLTR